jgi:hypothetical protein
MKSIIFSISLFISFILPLSAISAEFYGSYVLPNKSGELTKRCMFISYGDEGDSYISGEWISKLKFCSGEFVK